MTQPKTKGPIPVKRNIIGPSPEAPRSSARLRGKSPIHNKSAKDPEPKDDPPENRTKEMDEAPAENSDKAISDPCEINITNIDYPNSYYDPDPISNDASAPEKETYSEAIHKL